MSKLIILCGIQGSGKSTWAKNYEARNIHAHRVSRDDIRMIYLQEDDNCFKYEKKVWDRFIRTIETCLSREMVVIADCMNLTEKSRAKLINALHIKPDVLECVCFFDVPLEVCLERNALRTGRARVPDEVAKNCYEKREYPSFSEGFDSIEYENEYTELYD